MSEKMNTESSDLLPYRRQPWTSWVTKLSGESDESDMDCRVTRLPRQDMGLFGLCPGNDGFYAVVCSTCNAVVKPQCLRSHQELKHGGEAKIVPSSILLPPPPIPVKRYKTTSVKFKNKKPTATVTSAALSHLSPHSADSIATSAHLTPALAKQVDTSFEAEGLPLANSTRRRSPNTGSDRKAHKFREKEFEIEKQFVNSENDKHICSRPTNLKSQSTRRTVSGRTKDSKLVTEYRTSKDQSLTGNGSLSSRSRSHSILKAVVAASAISSTALSSAISDSGFSSSNSSQSSQNSTLAPDTAPSSPTLHDVVTTTVESVTSSSDFVTVCAGGAMKTSDIPVMTNTTSMSLLKSTEVDVITSTATGSTQVVHMVPTTSHLYTLSAPGSSMITVNTNLKESVSAVRVTSPLTTELLASTPPPQLSPPIQSSSPIPAPRISPPLLPVQTQPQPIIVSRDVIESLNLPVVMQMPPLPTSLANITVYTRYPKPLVVSTFCAKKVGNALVFRNRRLDIFREQFITLLRNARRTANAQMNATGINQDNISPLPSPSSSPSSPSPSPIFGVNTLSSANTLPRSSPTLPNIQAASLLAHRPNILRTTAAASKQPREHIPKMLSTGLKRPGVSGPPLASLDCKHMLLKPAGIIGKMIVHQHEVTDVNDGSAVNHLTLDKVVPVNIK